MIISVSMQKHHSYLVEHLPSLDGAKVIRLRPEVAISWRAAVDEAKINSHSVYGGGYSLDHIILLVGHNSNTCFTTSRWPSALKKGKISPKSRNTFR